MSYTPKAILYHQTNDGRWRVLVRTQHATSEVYSWCVEHCSAPFEYANEMYTGNNEIIYFANEEDLLLYRMKWLDGLEFKLWA